MKKLIVVMSLLSSLSAMATEFTVKMEDVKCTIKNNEVVRTELVGRGDMVATVTEKKTVSFTGVDALVAKALETATDAPANEFYSVSMNHEGKSYNLRSEDSKETMVLIRLLGRTCR